MILSIFHTLHGHLNIYLCKVFKSCSYLLIYLEIVVDFTDRCRLLNLSVQSWFLLFLYYPLMSIILFLASCNLVSFLILVICASLFWFWEKSFYFIDVFKEQALCLIGFLYCFPIFYFIENCNYLLYSFCLLRILFALLFFFL